MTRAKRGRAAPLALARSVPATAWLAAIVVGAALVHYAFGRRVIAPWIMVDELIYSELAKSFAESGTFELRGEPAGGGYGVVYPVLISPAFRLFDSIPDAYALAKAINAVAVSLVAVPAYLLARRCLTRPAALVAALLSVAVPHLLYAGTLMTESAFYPLFVLAALALVRVLERPTAWRTVAFLAASGLAFQTRAQAVVLGAAAVSAPAVLALMRREGARGLLAYRTLYGVTAAAVVLVLAAQAARGRSPLAVLGAYREAAEHDYALGDVLRWALYSLAGLDLAVAVVPFAALLILAGVSRRLLPADQAVVAVTLTLTAWLVLQVGAYASQPFIQRVEERNLFYVAPLLFVALLLWIERELPRPRVAATLAALAAALLPAVLPYEDLIGVSAVSDTFSLLPWWTVNGWGVPLDWIVVVVVAVAAAVSALVLVVPVRFAIALPAVVLAALVASFQPVASRVRDASIGALFQGITVPDRAWIDAAVGRDADVAAVWSGKSDVQTVWQNEFFSRSVGGAYHVTGPLPSGIPQTAVALDRRSGLLRAEGRPVPVSYVFADDAARIAGREVARDARKGTAVYRVDGLLRVHSSVEGLHDDLWAGRRLVYRRYRCTGGSLAVTLESDRRLFDGDQVVTARADGRTSGRASVPPGRKATLAVPLVPRGGRCVVTFSTARTRVPARVQPGSEDTRALGVRFLSFTVRR